MSQPPSAIPAFEIEPCAPRKSEKLILAIGGGAGQILATISPLTLRGIECAVCDTDTNDLCQSPIAQRLQLGVRGISTEGQTSIAAHAAIDAKNTIDHLIGRHTKILYLVVTLGGGTGSGAAPIIAQQAHQKGILTIAIVSLPFGFESSTRKEQALDAVEQLAKEVDTLFIVDLNKHLDQQPTLTLQDAKKTATAIFREQLNDLLLLTAHDATYGTLDLTTLNRHLQDGKIGWIIAQENEGKGRATAALRGILETPKFKQLDLLNAPNILLGLYGPPEGISEHLPLTMEDVSAVTSFADLFPQSCNFYSQFGASEQLTAKLRAVIIATEFSLDSIEEMQPRLQYRAAVAALQSATDQHQLTERRQRFYDQIATPARNLKPKHIFLFDNDQLDDEALAEQVAIVPTCRRTVTELHNFQHHSSKDPNTE